MKAKDILNELAKLFAGFIFHKRFIKELTDLLTSKLRGKEEEEGKKHTNYSNYTAVMESRCKELLGGVFNE